MRESGGRRGRWIAPLAASAFALAVLGVIPVAHMVMMRLDPMYWLFGGEERY